MAQLGLRGTLDAFVAEEQRGDPLQLRPQRIEAPTLILHGNDDYLVPAAVGEDLEHRISDATFLLVPEASHMLPVTHPDLTAAAIHALVTEH